MASTIPVRVVSIIDGAPDIKIFEFETADGTGFPVFEPGSHVDLHLGPALVRQYSVCSIPGHSRLRLAIKLEAASRGGSLHAHRVIREGDLLAIAPPRNNFGIEWAAAHHVLIAGGIGITPMLSMAYHLKHAGASFELHDFCRSIEHAVFADEIQAAFREQSSIHVGASAAQVADRIESILSARPAGTHVYACGPTAMIDLVSATARRHVPVEAFHHELFAARDDPGRTDDRPFDVVLARSGKTLSVPVGKSIAQVLRDHGVEVPVSCEQGVCGTCLTGVIAGIPDHRDEVLSDAARSACRTIAPCVSRAVGDSLVLDL